MYHRIESTQRAKQWLSSDSTPRQTRPQQPSHPTSKAAPVRTRQTPRVQPLTHAPVLITGVSPGGLGHETARAIALHSPKLLILAGRSASKVDAAQSSIQKATHGTPLRALIVDLSSLSSVRKAAAEVHSWADVPAIDVVINNAGIMATPFALTGDGIESQFHANHIGHFLLTQLLMPKILAAGPGARVVNLSSNAYKMGGVHWDDINFGVSPPDV